LTRLQTDDQGIVVYFEAGARESSLHHSFRPLKGPVSVYPVDMDVSFSIDKVTGE
jgi:hypothetical protein